MGTTHKTRRVPAGRVKNGEKRRISLHVSAEMGRKLEAMAKTEKRTLNAQCELLFEIGIRAAAAAAAT